jgi:uncharacterized protein
VSQAALLDVNVLLALFNREHTHHDVAHDWLADASGSKWATCATTQNGFVRLISNPASRTGGFRAVEAADLLRRFCSSTAHTFWTESVSLTDTALFDLSKVSGHQQITDVYLLGLAKTHGGTLVTFDSSIPLKAVIGATRRHLVVLGQADE